MIGLIRGTLLKKTPPTMLIECHGVGYEVDVSMSTYYNLPDEGQEVMLFTQLIVREDAHLLYGFNTEEERGVFRQLIKISGVGARTALSILSGMSIGDIVQSVLTQDAARFAKVPGIGKKTAERLLLELKGKLTDIQDTAIPTTDSLKDIMDALASLGYSSKEIAVAIKQVPADASVADGLKLALNALFK